jgi:mannosyltransferase OCH1-like enzyme
MTWPYVPAVSSIEVCPTLEAYRACQHPAMKSDFFRLAYLYLRGGIYIDADEECLCSIEPLRRRPVALIARRMTTGLTYLNNAPLFCVPRVPLLLRCLERATDTVLSARRQRLKVWVSTGPGNLLRVFADAVLRADAQPRTLILDDCDRFSRVAFCEYKLTGRYWIHHDERGLAKARLLIRAFPDRMRLALARVPGARVMWRTVKRARGRLAGALIPIRVELADTIPVVVELANATC